MFSQACQEFCQQFCLRRVYIPLGRHPPPGRHSQPGRHPQPGRHSETGRHPLDRTPPPFPEQTHAQPPRLRMQWTVRILLECFLVDKVFTALELDDNGKFYSCWTQMALFRSSDLFPGRNRKIFIYPSPCFAFKSFKLEENPNKEAGWFFAQLVVVSEQQGKAMVLDIISECHLCFIKHRRK